MQVTAVDGGHVTNIEEANAIIRKIVEARKSTEAMTLDDNEELQAELDAAADMGAATPMPGMFEMIADNPKDIVGSDKLPLHLWPTTATAMGCIALLNGALKYGRSNWRAVGVRASIYVDACQRHLAAWFEGEEADEEGVPHLSAALACLAILVDCQAAGKLKDDRQYPGGHRELIDSLTPHVKRLKELHSGRSPQHYVRP